MHGTLSRNGCLASLVLILALSASALPAPAADTITNRSDAALKYEEPRHLTGAIYGQGAEKEKLFYKFQRTATRSGSQLTVQRDYTSPDGRLAAQERAVYEGNDMVSYELKEPTIGSEGSATIKRDAKNPAKGSIEFQFKSETGAKPKLDSEALRENTLVNDMIAPYLASHWDALIGGEKLKCRYVVVPRKETVGFTFVKESESTWRNQSVIILKMEPTSPIISALVDPLYFTMQKAPPHHILQYVGRTTPKVQVGGKWKDLDAVTVYDWDSAR
jgi:hypothetical protein